MERGVDTGLLGEAQRETEMLLARTQDAVERMTRLQALTAGLAPLRDRQAVADFVLGGGVAALGGQTGSLCLLTEAGDELEIVADSGYPDEVRTAYARFALDAPLPASEATRTGAPVYLESPADRDARYPLLASGPLVPNAAYAIVPLSAGGGPSLGALVVGFATPRSFDDDDRAFLEALASQCAVALERARFSEEAQRGQRRLAFLANVSGFLAGALDPDVALHQVAALAVPTLADACTVHLSDRDAPATGIEPAVAAVLATGTPEIGPHLLVLPLRARGRILGAISLVTRGARELTGVDVSLARDMAARAAVALDTARLFSERTQIARRLQDSLLPSTLPAVPGIELGARYRAAGEGLDVGGDFYDAFWVSPGRWMLAVGDVRGHGVESAAVTGLARHTIRSAAIAGGSPRQILAHLNDVLLRHDAERASADQDDWEATEPRFLTVLLVAVEPAPGGADLVVCAAGHPLPLLRHAGGTVVPVGRPGTLVGAMRAVDLAETPVHLVPGDALVCFTDGVVEEHEGGRFVGETGIARAIAGAGRLDATGLAELVESTAVEFADGAPGDDMAVLVLRVSPEASA